jgi:hypothetical protein
VGLAENFGSLLFCSLGLAERIAHRIDLLPQGRLTKRFRDVTFHRHKYILPQASKMASQVFEPLLRSHRSQAVFSPSSFQLYLLAFRRLIG